MDDLLGLHLQSYQLGYTQIILRAVIVFFAALIMVRTSARRFLGRKTVFDFILAIMLGSILSRAVNGSAPFLPTLAGCFVLIWTHRLLAALSFHFHWVGRIVKGTEEVLIENGQVKMDALRRNYFTERDLLEDLRLKSYERVGDVKSARLERSGDVSVIGFGPDHKRGVADSRTKDIL